MVVQCHVVLDELLQHGVVLLQHGVGHLLLVFGYISLGLSFGELVVGGSEDGEHLAAVQRLGEVAGLDHLGKVGQLGVGLDGLPQGTLMYAIRTA